MTCKDCFHYDTCIKIFITEKETVNPEKNCPSFKDKSRFVELPCKVGDIVYEIAINHEMIIESEIHEHKIKDFEDMLMLLLDLQRGWIVRFYTDKSKAEEKLKELKENGSN